MSLLRIYCPLDAPPLRCQWALLSDGRPPFIGEGPLAQLPQRHGRVQVVVPAAQVLLTPARLPAAAKRNAGSVLAYAVEEDTATEPDDNRVCWLGTDGEVDRLAVLDHHGLQRWSSALEDAGITSHDVHSEMLLLPLAADEWSIAWNGVEGFVRTGELAGAATDCGDRTTPPLALRRLLDAAATRGARPNTLALYAMSPDAAPDLDAWQRTLGITLRNTGPWDWRTAPADAGVSLIQQRRRWRLPAGNLARLRPAAWIAGIALVLHALLLVADWTLLASDARALRQQMEARFRAAFPDAVAVVDPVLQMRRNLAQARRAAGRPDGGDFLPMIEQVAVGMKDLPANSLRTVSYESGRLTLQFSATEKSAVQRLVARLQQSGLSVEATPDKQGAGAVVIVVRAS